MKTTSTASWPSSTPRPAEPDWGRRQAAAGAAAADRVGARPGRQQRGAIGPSPEDRLTGPSLDTVVFLTDYGTADEFVGIVHRVVRRIAPHVAVIDLTHQVPPYDVRAGALMLWRAAPWLAPAVVLAVVDPGVGTDRRAVALEVEAGGGPLLLVGPDNGLLIPAALATGEIRRSVLLDNPRWHLPATGRGVTFAGRDVFAPTAAHLCRGVDLAELGSAVDPASLRGEAVGEAVIRRRPGLVVETEVVVVDRFGNAALNLRPGVAEALGPRPVVLVGPGPPRPLTRVETFGDLAPDQLGLLTDSSGLMALCLDRRSAAAELGLAAGDRVELRPPGGEPAAGDSAGG